MAEPAPRRGPGWLGTFLLMALAAGAVWYWQGQVRQRDLAAIQSTVTAQLEKIGKATQPRGNVVSTEDLEKRIREGLGRELLAKIAKANGTAESLVVAVGEVKGQVSKLASVPVAARDDGSFDATLVQERKPPLAQVDVAWKPGQPLSTYWTSYTEQFKVQVGQWRTGEDGARAAISLERHVLRDGRPLGTEQIPIPEANAYFSTDMIRRQVPVPRYTFFAGSLVNRTGTHGVLMVQKHLNRSLSLTTGWTTDHSVLVLGSYTFGSLP